MPSAGHPRPQERKARTDPIVEKGVDEATLLGLGPRPRDLALWCQSRMEEGGLVPPHSVLAPGTALGLLRSRALSSAQAKGIVVVEKGRSHREQSREGR
jgi:hypothetical protein